MKIFHSITGKTLYNKEKNEDIRRCGMANIRELTYKRKKEWNAHLEGMGQDGIVRRVKNRSTHWKGVPRTVSEK